MGEWGAGQYDGKGGYPRSGPQPLVIFVVVGGSVWADLRAIRFGDDFVRI